MQNCLQGKNDMATIKKKPSKKVVKKKKPTGKPRPKKIHAESELSNGWKLAGTLKRTDMKSAKDPIGKLHKKLKEFLPSGTSITQFGMGRAALAYFREQITLQAMREYGWLSEKKLQSVIEVTLLQCEPCDIEGVEGFEVYVRSENWRDKNV